MRSLKYLLILLALGGCGVNPVTGEPVFKTLNYSAQLLRPGEETELKRETAGTYYVVIEGTGATEIAGKRFEWEPNDIFVVPNFVWRRKSGANASSGVTTIFSSCRTSCGGATSIPARPTR